MEKTAVQQVFSELENLHPHLFNIYSTEGREFVNHFHKFLEIEKQQIIDAYINGIRLNLLLSDCMSHEDIVEYANKYYNEKFSN